MINYERVALYRYCVTHSSFDLVDSGLWLGLLKQLHLIISFCLIRALHATQALQKIVPCRNSHRREDSHHDTIDLEKSHGLTEKKGIYQRLVDDLSIEQR